MMYQSTKYRPAMKLCTECKHFLGNTDAEIPNILDLNESEAFLCFHKLTKSNLGLPCREMRSGVCGHEGKLWEFASDDYFNGEAA